MQVIKSLIRLVVLISPVCTFAQSTFISQGDKAYDFINRLEIKEATNNVLNFSSIKPFNRKNIVAQAEKYYTDSAKSSTLTNIDRYDLHSLMMNNSEWAKIKDNSFLNNKPFLGALYTSKANLYEYNGKDFFVSVNPVPYDQKFFGSP